ncbi:hypothetical protein [Xenophilus sp. Marseille-Q4582]|uniref:hypothetical protein n=1 Tax=Xenophilus sp. Marseille-Q4582 TaxID=2866600 RepID=UPI001CE479FB|nr:hypothetical protein [Xenophilus sp. Marseille-Q4582]
MSDATQSQEVNYLQLSDEEVMGMQEPVATISPESAGNEIPAPDTTTDTADGSNQAGDDGRDGEAANGEGSDEAAGDKPADEEGAEAGGSEASDAKDEGGNQAEDGPAKPAADTPAPIDYEAEYKRLMAPIKAAGKEIQLKSIDDAISLVQKGVGFTARMAALKPHLKLLKLLENNGLMSEERISYLIDLNNKNPGAINKLVQESGIDPMDISAEKASEYKQTAYAVDDRELELDMVLDEIKDSPAYTQTLKVIGSQWDAASKRQIADAPQLIQIINTHIERGIYDLIAKEVENEKLFGRLNGLSDIEAYRQVGDRLNASGAFAHLVAPTSAQAGKREVTPPQPKRDEGKVKDLKRAASSTKSTANKAPAAEFNPLAMSDAEFEKLASSQYL